MGLVTDTSLSRRNFLSLTAAVSVAVGLTRTGVAEAAETNIALGKALMAPMAADLDILNFALTLEFLEAELYRVLIATGFLSGKELGYIQQFGAAEASHATTLVSVITKLGGTPVQKKSSYNFAALAPNINNRGDVLNTLIAVEDVGVGAYQGAADKIQDGDLLTAAGGILQVEARHAAFVRYLAGVERPVPAPFTKSIPADQVLAAVRPVLGS